MRYKSVEVKQVDDGGYFVTVRRDYGSYEYICKTWDELIALLKLQIGQ